MQPNQGAEGALRSYLGMKAPGYAFLIDAPWGAGKTHFVRRVCQVDSKREDVRYVSLNGVSEERAFRRALLRESFKGSTTNIVTAVGDMIGQRLSLGDLGSFGRDLVEEQLIARLPDTLIFDDIERSSLSPQILFGLINEFVEHQSKRVILVAHAEAHDDQNGFLKRKEKLVGRTIGIVADFNAAFPAFLSAVDNGPGNSYFNKHIEIVKSIFDQAGHNNLRLLRSAVRDCALVLDRIDDELFDAKEPMARFVRTYLAFAMALAKGEISPSDLDKRDHWKIAVSKDVDDEFKPLNELFKRHKGADIYAHSGATLSKSLAEILFSKGFADSSTLNLALRATGQFEPQDENPLWLRMLYWTRLEWDKLPDLVDEGNTYLFEASTVAAGPYLHIVFCMFWIEKHGGLAISRTELRNNILKRIEKLAECGSIPAAQLGVRFGWDRRGNQFSFGGHAVDIDDDYCEIMTAMADAQLRAFHNNISLEANSFLSCYELELTRFGKHVSYSHDSVSYYHFPIFKFLSLDGFATATIAHLRCGRVEQVGEIFSKIAERHSDTKVREEEKCWFKKLRKVLEDRAAAHSRLATAQLEQFFKWYWKFEKHEDSSGCIDRD